jgi:hypothetical protein
LLAPFRPTLFSQGGNLGSIPIHDSRSAHDCLGRHHGCFGGAGRLPGTLSSKEDDQIFIDAAEQHHYQEQLVIIDRISRLTRPIIALAVLSGMLLLASMSVWVYQAFKSF